MPYDLRNCTSIDIALNIEREVDVEAAVRRQGHRLFESAKTAMALDKTLVDNTNRSSPQVNCGLIANSN
ncbi:MAG: hypothetical protein AABP62_20235 [Planctomycetota bacterium]